jgi:adenine-specific DNA-methyltransferase
MPSLNWIGKDKVLNHHNEVPYRVLNKKYSYGDDDAENMVIHGDNLEALKSLLPKYEGKIKCIYIDPPYNTGNEGWVYNDNVNDPRIVKWLGEIVGKDGEDLSRHDKWLCMMYPRLRLLHKLLSPRGAIFISIDDNEQAFLKLLCDEIFGSSHFIAQAVWKRRASSAMAYRNVSIDHEYVLIYGKEETDSFYGIEKD